MKILAIVTARMTSNRLPGKVLLKVKKKPFLQFLIERLKIVKKIDQIVIATTINKTDDVLEKLPHINISLKKNESEMLQG